MELKSGLRLTQSQVLSLLERFDDSSDIPLHKGLDFESYSKKLSDFAYFILAIDDNKQLGFVAYYLNDEDHFAYIPQVVVHQEGRHKGIGHLMFEELFSIISTNYSSVKLEVLKNNSNARSFYSREGFVEVEDRNERLLLKYDIL